MTVIHSSAATSPDQGAPREARHCATCRCDTGHTCECGHDEVFHNFGTRQGVEVRTGCTWTAAKRRQPTPCTCTQYRPKGAT